MTSWFHRNSITPNPVVGPSGAAASSVVAHQQWRANNAQSQSLHQPQKSAISVCDYNKRRHSNHQRMHGKSKDRGYSHASVVRPLLSVIGQDNTMPKSVQLNRMEAKGLNILQSTSMYSEDTTRSSGCGHTTSSTKKNNFQGILPGGGHEASSRVSRQSSGQRTSYGPNNQSLPVERPKTMILPSVKNKDLLWVPKIRNRLPNIFRPMQLQKQRGTQQNTTSFAPQVGVVRIHQVSMQASVQPLRRADLSAAPSKYQQNCQNHPSFFSQGSISGQPSCSSAVLKGRSDKAVPSCNLSQSSGSTVSIAHKSLATTERVVSEYTNLESYLNAWLGSTKNDGIEAKMAEWGRDAQDRHTERVNELDLKLTELDTKAKFLKDQRDEAQNQHGHRIYDLDLKQSEIDLKAKSVGILVSDVCQQAKDLKQQVMKAQLMSVDLDAKLSEASKAKNDLEGMVQTVIALKDHAKATVAEWSKSIVSHLPFLKSKTVVVSDNMESNEGSVFTPISSHYGSSRTPMHIASCKDESSGKGTLLGKKKMSLKSRYDPKELILLTPEKRHKRATKTSATLCPLSDSESSYAKIQLSRPNTGRVVVTATSVDRSTNKSNTCSFGNVRSSSSAYAIRSCVTPCDKSDFASFSASSKLTAICATTPPLKKKRHINQVIKGQPRRRTKVARTQYRSKHRSSIFDDIDCDQDAFLSG